MGALHGVALILLNCGDKIFGRDGSRRLKILRPLAWFVTFHFVCFTFVVFNTGSLADTQMVFDALFANETGWAAPKQADVLLLAAFGLMICSTRICFACLTAQWRHWKKCRCGFGLYR